MPTLPAASSFTGPTVTEAQFKTAITDQREFLAGLLGTAGTQAAALTTLGAALNGTLAKTAAYTVVTADRGKLIDCTTGTWTLSLTASATLGNGFSFGIVNAGTGIITIDPNGAETIDGAATLLLTAGQSCFVTCNGSDFRTIGLSSAVPGFKNKIINGKMEIAQRGTSFAGAGNVYTLDRWADLNIGTSSVVTYSQQADAPSSNEFQNSIRVAVTTADTSIAAGDVRATQQPIEGYNVRDLIGKTFTLSFWVRSSKTGTHCVNLRNGYTADRSYVAEYTVNAANTWEQKSITVSGGLITAGTWNWTNGLGLIVSWALAAGSTYQTTAGAWQTGNYLSTANQVNCLDTIGNIFAITGVQLEAGSVATPFEHRPYGTELALCQRYYDIIRMVLRGSDYANVYPQMNWHVVMRAAPTISLSSGTATMASFAVGCYQNSAHSGGAPIAVDIAAAAEL